MMKLTCVRVCVSKREERTRSTFEGKPEVWVCAPQPHCIDVCILLVDVDVEFSVRMKFIFGRFGKSYLFQLFWRYFYFLFYFGDGSCPGNDQQTR